MAEDNKALWRRLVNEFWNSGNLALADEFVSAQYVWNVIGSDEEFHGPEGFREAGRKWRGAFPDLHLTLGDMLSEGDKLACAWSWTGTHLGELQGIAPTGRKVNVSGMTLFTIANGKFVREVVYADLLGLMKQLGVLPG